MISFIKGTIADVESDKVVVECNNIGYNIFVPLSVIDKTRIGIEVKLHTYLSVREDAMVLFGFLSKEELDIFKKIIGVSGIGPKGALGILSALSVDNLKIAIVSEDAKAISKAPGIGAKTASKLILELKDKIHTEDIFDVTEDMGAAMDNINADVQRDAIEALTSLGYSPSQAVAAVKNICKSNSTINNAGELIKLALKSIAL